MCGPWSYTANAQIVPSKLKQVRRTRAREILHRNETDAETRPEEDAAMRWRPANLRAFAVTAGFAVVLVSLLALTGVQKSQPAPSAAQGWITSRVSAVVGQNLPLLERYRRNVARTS